MAPKLKNLSTPISLSWVGNKAPIDTFELGVKYIANPDLVNTGRKLVDEFQKGYNGVSLSGCFATANGDIGYIGVVKHPIRTDIFAANQIQNGKTAQSQWKGSDHLKHRIGGFGFPRSRGQTQTNQLRKMIESKKKIGYDDMKDLQGNVYDQMAYEMKERMIKTLDKFENSYNLSNSTLFNLAKIYLTKWDGLAQKESVGASIFFVWEQKIWDLCFDQYIFENKAEKTSYFKSFKPDQQRNLNDQICGSKGCIHLVMTSFLESIQYLEHRFGQDINLWQWGHLHRMHFKHAFSSLNILKPFFHKSYPYGGSRRTLNVGVFYSINENGFDSVHSANIRMISIMDGQDITNSITKDYENASYFSINVGVSGVKGTTHYSDFLESHRDLKYAKMNYNMRKGE